MDQGLVEDDVTKDLIQGLMERSVNPKFRFIPEISLPEKKPTGDSGRHRRPIVKKTTPKLDQMKRKTGN